MIARLQWPTERLATHRRDELRRLVRTAKELSPWHRERLGSIDPDRLNEESLVELPVMTKADLMEHFDQIVTDDRIRLDVAEAHLESVRLGPGGMGSNPYLFDRYTVTV